MKYVLLYELADGGLAKAPQLFPGLRAESRVPRSGGRAGAAGGSHQFQPRCTRQNVVRASCSPRWAAENRKEFKVKATTITKLRLNKDTLLSLSNQELSYAAAAGSVSICITVTTPRVKCC